MTIDEGLCVQIMHLGAFDDEPATVALMDAYLEAEWMRYFYEMYPDAIICPQVEDELITDANRPQVGDDLQIIFRIPWGHNKIILDKCKGNSAKALFYIRKTIENNWSRDVLLNFLGTDLYERQGKAITNFSNTLPMEQSDLAQAITKDPYGVRYWLCLYGESCLLYTSPSPRD